MKYMLDTDTCIYLIKKHSDRIIQKFHSVHAGEIYISSITLAELAFGVEKSTHQRRNKVALDMFTQPLEIADFNEKAAYEYGRIRAYLQKQGTPIGPFDMTIAAHAKSLELILVTNNIREFSRIPKLQLENWA